MGILQNRLSYSSSEHLFMIAKQDKIKMNTLRIN